MMDRKCAIMDLKNDVWREIEGRAFFSLKI